MNAKPVVVAGAGLAGISAAVELAGAGIPVMLLEKTARLGGRAGSGYSRLEASGAESATSGHTTFPLGNHLFLGCCTAYLNLLEILGTRRLTYLQPRLSLAVASGGKLGRLHAAQASMPSPLPLLPALLRYPYLNAIDKAAVGRAILAIYSSNAVRSGESFAEWLHRHRQSVAARRYFWELISAPTMNAPAEQTSAELALLVFRQAILGSGQAAALGFWPPDPALLLQPLYRYLERRGGSLLCKAALRQVRPSPNGDHLLLYTSIGEIAAEQVVIAVPYQQLGALLPAEWSRLPVFARLAGLPSRPIVDVFLTYDTPQTAQRVTAIPGLPALWVFAESCRNQQRLAVSISCPGSLAQMPAAQLVDWTQTRLAAAFGHPLPGKLLSCKVLKHMHATFSAAPEHQQLRPPTRTPITNLLLAGDYTATGWPATMEGAVRSGIAAAQEVIAQRLQRRQQVFRGSRLLTLGGL